MIRRRAVMTTTAPPPPVCDTPGCGRQIPAGGEGHPEICPVCLNALKINGEGNTAGEQYARDARLVTRLPTSDVMFHAASRLALSEPLLAAELRARGSRLANARQQNPRHAVVAFVEEPS